MSEVLIMNKIIPISDLRNTTSISKLCNKEDRPIIITRNGYSDLVIMSIKAYERMEGFKNLEEANTKIPQVKNSLPQDECLGFIKVASANFDVEINDVSGNTNKIISTLKEAYANGAKVICFPELCITAYSCGDMFYQQTLLKEAEKALEVIAKSAKDIDAFYVVGVPLKKDGKLFNCGVAFHKDKILGVVPKSFIPNYNEFYEKRYFTEPVKGNTTINILGKEYPFGTKLLFKNSYYTDEVIGIEICEDVWMSIPPSSKHALAGATIECNPSASTETLHKADGRRDLIAMQARKANIGYIYSSASYFESTTDVIYSSHNIIAEPDGIIAESDLFKSNITYGEIDLDRINIRKVQETSQGDINRDKYLIIPFASHVEIPKLSRKYKKYPFIDDDPVESRKTVLKAIEMQGYAIARRLQKINCHKLVVGLSGGLDSTIALIAATKAFEILGYDPKDIIAITMPCFGTSARTKNNAIKLAEFYKVTLIEVNIGKSVEQHLIDIGHDINDHSVTYENAQARERTQILMDYANKHGAIVLGTGDLSEIALGWSTYNGDHMSMYGVNGSFTKTFIREMTRVLAEVNPGISDVLLDILGTPVSPELIPPKEGEISQLTEDIVGPYELHDFFLYHFIYEHMSVRKVYYIAKDTFKDEYRVETIRKWFETFLKRFFNNQFKRSCMPDGAKVGTVNLSPRGDWRMPSDACASLWLAECDTL